MGFHFFHKRDKLKRKFSFISDKDLKYRIGKEKDLLNRLSRKLGKSDEEVLGILIDL